MVRFPGSGGSDGDDQEPKSDPDILPIRPDGLPVDPMLLMFVVQLTLNDGSATTAAKQMGWAGDKGRRLCAKHPQLREIAKNALSLNARATIRSWTQMHAKALRTINEKMDSEDERVSLAAAQTVVERVEGKTPQKGGMPVELGVEEVMENVTIRFATAYHLERQVSLADALLYAEQNPDAVSAWGKRHGLIQAA